MGKIIRPTYPKELSIGLLLLVFAVSFFLSGQIFKTSGHDASGNESLYLAMFLLSIAVIIMMLVLWEEFLFPIKVKFEAGGVIFRNHRNKLKNQLLIYCAIPVIFAYVYYKYPVNHFYFIIWAAVCIISPVAGKLISGIKNYNDFLRLTKEKIEYKNNDDAGTIALKDIQHITMIRDQRSVLHKIQLLTTDNKTVTIDLDEMELADFFAAIDTYISTEYKSLVKGTEKR